MDRLPKHTELSETGESFRQIGCAIAANTVKMSVKSSGQVPAAWLFKRRWSCLIQKDVIADPITNAWRFT
jgi:hypothetical protein